MDTLPIEAASEHPSNPGSTFEVQHAAIQRRRTFSPYTAQIAPISVSVCFALHFHTDVIASNITMIAVALSGMLLALTLCIVLHAILVLIYAAIVATYEAGVFNRPLRLSQNAVHTVVTIVSQVFTILYCAVLVFLTQRIALHEFLKRPQTLTAMHDKSSAWLGLGSSLQTLSNQRKLVTDFLGVSLVALYLLLIFVVHTTLASIFGGTTQNVTIATSYPTVLARQPNITTMLEGGPELSDLRSILEVYDTLNITTAGVLDSTLYDILPVAANVADIAVEVNATMFSVDCAPLPDAVQTIFYANASDVDNFAFSGVDAGTPDGPAYVFGFGGGKYSTNLYPMSTGSFQVLNVNPGDPDSDDPGPSMLVVASTFLVVDSAGQNATTVGVNPIWQDSPEGIDTPISTVSIVGCNFSAQNSTVEVNPQTRAVNQIPSSPADARWHDWTDPGVSSDPLLTDPLQIFASISPASTSVFDVDPITVYNDTFQAISMYRLSLIDAFLYVDISASRNASLATSGPVTVGELNWSLGRAYAAVLWYYNSASFLDVAISDITDEKQQGQVSIPSIVLQERMSVNTVSLFVGLGAACALFVLAVVLVARSGAFARNVIYNDVSGLLPVLWLLGNEPGLTAVEKPDVDALRAAGMYEVARLSKQRRRMDLDATEDNAAELELETFSDALRSSDPLLVHRKAHVCSQCGGTCADV
ncbi:hypothetical protein NM688_g1777 [Phlebia brevispora]|uniref:Uncharacterized protein n=1 Tax=Phlebia brevispora TaxID=194682 RepID=A0ACC1TAG1_9APHY|nr:hypothetical protein NM688_g1777 [Phlebia brevispora]